MSNMNYNKMYDSDKEKSTDKVGPAVQKPVATSQAFEPKQTVVEPAVAPVAPVVSEPKVPETKKATVVGCAKLNVREKPVSGSKVLEIIDVNDEVEICNLDARGKFYPVRTASGTEGYCMKEFLKMK